MKIFLPTLCLLYCLSSPTYAFAYGCDCGSVQNMITIAKNETISEVNLNTTLEAEAIRSEILVAAQNIIGTIKIESATIVRAIVALKESNAAILKGQSVATEAIRTEDMYGQAAQPSGLCGASSLGAGIQLGVHAGQDVQSTMREKQHAHGNTENAIPIDYLLRILEDDHPKEEDMAEAFFPLQSTLTEDQVVIAHEAIKTLVNPRPMPVVTAEQKETPSGQTYAAARIVHEGRMTTLMDTLNAHVVYHAPTLPDDVATWAQEQWAEAGGSDPVPGLVDSKLSEAGLYKLLSQMRVGNPNWFAQIASATEAGLLRELVLIQSFQFELTRKNTELLDRIAFMTSLDALARMETGATKDLNDLYMRMVGAQQ